MDLQSALPLFVQFTESGEDAPRVVVANTGDSRLITDDARGVGPYRQITTDHRPGNPAEKKRLTECVARGETTLSRSSDSSDVRVFPGGLSVSRTIGDGNCSRAVICTPEVINVPLKICVDNAEEKTQRFVLASDGLWDVVDNEVVGAAAARMPALKRTISKDGSRQSPKSEKNGKICTPKEAATKVLQKCLDAGGSRDDITICVVDVSYVV
jgi:serine/threonine protein phosphatase PrpC